MKGMIIEFTVIINYHHGDCYSDAIRFSSFAKLGRPSLDPGALPVHPVLQQIPPATRVAGLALIGL